MKKNLILSIFFCAQQLLLPAMEPNPADYVLAQEGELPLLITVPHGGHKEIPGARARKSLFFMPDRHSLELAHAIYQKFNRECGKKPSLVTALFSRYSIDANRPIRYAIADQKLEPIYNAYHDTIKKFIAQLKSRHPNGVLLLDIHGQKRDPDTIHRGTKNGLTMKKFILRYGTKGVSGKESIFGMLAKKGYTIFPPEDELNLTPESVHFDGGYTVCNYANNDIDTMQVEVGLRWRETEENREQFATDFTQAVVTFLKEYYIPRVI